MTSSSEQVHIFTTTEDSSDPMEITGVARIANAYAHIKKTMVKHYCDNCGETITGKGVEIEVEMNFPGNEGAPEYDAPVIRYVCSNECKNEMI